MIRLKLTAYTLVWYSSLILLSFGIPKSLAAQFLQLKFDHITSEDGLPHSTIHGITKDKYGFMWFGTWSGLCRYDGYNMHVFRYDAENPKSLINNRIHNVLTDAQGNIWVSTFDEEFLCRYNYTSDDFDRIPIMQCPPGIIEKINRRNHRLQVNFNYQKTRWHIDNHSTALVETYLPTGKQKTYQADPGNPWAINDAYISDLYLDDQHILWLGTYSNGINRSYLDANPFHYLYHDPNRPNTLAENTIRSISKAPNGTLWVGTRSKGITAISKDGSYRQFRQQNSALSNNYIKKILCDREGFVWIGNQTGLNRYNPHTQRIEAINHSEALSTGVYGMDEDSLGNIWLATWNGIAVFDRQKQQVERLELNISLPTTHIWCIFIDHQGQIWAGTEGGGVFVFQKGENGQLKLINKLQHGGQQQNALTLSDNRIYNVFEDAEKKIWIGTGNGLNRYDPDSNRVERFSQQGERWPKGSISGITEDHRGFLWVSHRQGISRIHKKSLDIHTFSKQDGLQSNEFADGALYRDTLNKRLYFGGNKGINYFCPDSIRTNMVPPNVVLTELRILNEVVQVNQAINGNIVLQKPLYLSSGIELTHADKSFSIAFAALHYTNPAGNQYAYMLAGFDKDWIYSDANQRIASYSNLAPGEYTFKVKAANSDGVWNNEPVELTIRVAPAIWASTGAYLLYVLLLLLLLYAFYYYITRYTQLKSKLNYEALLHQKERELHENKVQFFTNISHEIKTPLTLILSPIAQLKAWAQQDKQAAEQLQTMETNGQHLLKTVNQLLDIRRFETGHEKLHLTRTNVSSLIQKVTDSFAQQARQKKIRLKTSPIEPGLFAMMDADKIEKVLYNLLSNALKFTDSGGLVKIRVRADDHTLGIDVLDNGNGIAKEDLERIFKPFLQGRETVPGGTGLGLSYSRALVEMHGGQLTVESRPYTLRNKLTIFHLTLPLTAGRVEAPSTDEAVNRQDETIQVPSKIPSAALPALPRRCRILLVEDNEQMRSYLSQFFAADYDVLEATNGEEGLKIAQKQLPDLIISDVMMPKTDGLSFTRQIKTNVLLRHIPVILLTAKSWVENELEGLETGADDYMVKPFHLPVLALKVRNQLLRLFHMQEKYKEQVVHIEPSKIVPTSPDERLLQKVLLYLEEHLQESDLKVEDIYRAVGLSRAQLYRKMKALTGSSMHDLLKELRLKRAKQLLLTQKFQINEIAYMVGFNDPEYFRRSFKAKFGVSPSALAKQHKSKEPE